MKKLELIKDGRLFTDDIGLVIFWQPIIDKVTDPKGIVSYRNSQDNTPIGLFRILKNEFNYEGEVSFDDGEGEVILDIKGKYVTIKE